MHCRLLGMIDTAHPKAVRSSTFAAAEVPGPQWGLECKNAVQPQAIWPGDSRYLYLERRRTLEKSSLLHDQR